MGDATRKWAIYTPRELTVDSLPTIVYLHSDAACGDDGWAPTKEGLGLAIRAQPERWPFRVLFPQRLERGQDWAYESEFLNSILGVEESRSRFVLIGLCEGADGAVTFSQDRSDRWHAVVSVGSRLDGVPAGLPSWTFVPADAAYLSIEAMKEKAKQLDGAMLTICLETGADTGRCAFQRSTLPEWIRTVRRSAVASRILANEVVIGIEMTLANATTADGERSVSAVTIEGVENAWSIRHIRDGIEIEVERVEASIAAQTTRLCILDMAMNGVFEWRNRPTNMTNAWDEQLFIETFTLGGASISMPIIEAETPNMPERIAKCLWRCRRRLLDLVR